MVNQQQELPPLQSWPKSMRTTCPKYAASLHLPFRITGIRCSAFWYAKVDLKMKRNAIAQGRTASPLRTRRQRPYGQRKTTLRTVGLNAEKKIGTEPKGSCFLLTFPYRTLPISAVYRDLEVRSGMKGGGLGASGESASRCVPLPEEER
jgi:hypothetical protein